MMDSSHSIPDGSEVGRRFELLLERFPRADGEPWRPIEIAKATGGKVNSSYISALRCGKLRKPGIEQLETIADLLGFPFKLWRIKPELWGEYLAENPAVRGSFRSPRPRQPVPRVPFGEELAWLLNALFERKSHHTGEPYTDEEAARRSRGWVSAEEIRAMRRGEQTEPPPEMKLVAISNVFGELPFYWYAPTKPGWITDEVEAIPRQPDRLDRDLTQAILERKEDLDVEGKRMLLAFIRGLEGLQRPEEGAHENGCGPHSKTSPNCTSREDSREEE